MATSGTVTINIVGDASKLKGAFSEAETGLAGFSAKMESLGSSLMGFGAKMTIGVTLPLALLGKAAFDAASDLTESLSKVNIVFGDSAGAIKSWADTAATSMGISKQAALEAAGTFGNLFRALGVGIPDATNMSKALVQLASDLASFNNADPTEVLLALRSGLVGEVEPLRKFGVSLSQARIEAEAMKLGLWDGIGAIDAAAKAQAAYSIILQDTALAQGDFARTSDEAANKQRTLSAQFQDSAAKLGTALLPIFKQLATALASAAEWFSNLSPEVQKFAVYAALAAAAIGPLATAIGALVTVIGVLASPVAVIVIAIGALVAAAVLLYMKWDEVWSAIANNPWLLAILAPLGAILLPIIALVGAIKLVEANWGTIWPIVQGIVEVAGNVIRPILSAIDSGARGIADAVQFLWGVWQAAWPVIQAILEAAWTVIGVILSACAGAVQAIAGAAQFLWGVWQEAWPVIQAVLEAAWGAMQPTFALLQGALSGVLGAIGWIKDNAGAAWDGFTSAVGAMWGAVQRPLNALLGVLNGVAGAARAVKNAIDAIPDMPNVSLPGGPSLGDQIANRPGKRAMGGPVLAGMTYLVGERGPELLRMGSGSGTVIPNHALGGGGTTNYSINVTVSPGGSPAETGRAIVEAIKSYEDRSGATWRAA